MIGAGDPGYVVVDPHIGAAIGCLLMALIVAAVALALGSPGPRR